MSWETSRNAVPEGITQTTVYDEATGERIATVFKAEAIPLIAAAPDLLAALRGLLTPCWCDPAPGTACAHVLAAEAAIARATGEV